MRPRRIATVGTALIALLVVLGLLVMGSGLLSLIPRPTPEVDTHYLLHLVGRGLL